MGRIFMRSLLMWYPSSSDYTHKKERKRKKYDQKRIPFSYCLIEMSASLNRFLCFGGTPFIYLCFVLAYSKIWLIEGDDCSFQKMSHSCVCVFGYSFGNKRRTHQPLRGGGGGGSVCGRVPSSGVSIEFFFLSSLWCIIRIDVEMEPTRNICQTGWKHLTDTSDPCGSIPHVNDPPFFFIRWHRKKTKK